jgi:hypothetical protein
MHKVMNRSQLTVFLEDAQSRSEDEEEGNDGGVNNDLKIKLRQFKE